MKKVWIPILVVVVVVVIVLGLRMRGSSDEADFGSFELVGAERGPIRVIVTASGVLEPIYQVEVKSKASGLIERMPVEEGDAVGQGDLLAELDRTEAQSEYDQARANLASAEANLEYLKKQIARDEGLYKQGLISDLQMEETRLDMVRAESQKVAAEATLTTARQRLDDTIVRSPMDGIVLQKSVEAGQVISSGINSYTGGTTIAVVADMSRMLVRTSVDEVDIGSVEIGQGASVTPDAFPTDVSRGKVIRIAPLGRIEQNVTTFEVTVEIPNTDLKLKAGMNSSVDLKVAEREDAILLPAEAVAGPSMLPKLQVLIPDLQLPEGLAGGPPPDGPAPGGSPPGGALGPGARGNMQFVIVEVDGRPTMRPVRTGLNDTEMVEILEGVEEGEKVMIASQSRALQSRAEFQDRMRQRSMGGFRRAN